jgi:peptide deformylase
MRLIYEEAFLRKPCKRVTVKAGLKIGRQLHNFLLILNRGKTSKKGIGLAAPQIGELSQVCVVQLPKLWITLINPEIINQSHGRMTWTEGCLSFPNKEVTTYRHSWVVVRADNLKEDMLFGCVERPYEYDKLLQSVVVQHEVDHLRQKLIFDRQEDLTDNYEGVRLGLSNQDGNSK